MKYLVCDCKMKLVKTVICLNSYEDAIKFVTDGPYKNENEVSIEITKKDKLIKRCWYRDREGIICTLPSNEEIEQIKKEIKKFFASYPKTDSRCNNGYLSLEADKGFVLIKTKWMYAKSEKVSNNSWYSEQIMVGKYLSTFEKSFINEFLCKLDSLSVVITYISLSDIEKLLKGEVECKTELCSDGCRISFS